jgi:predicted dehydrogenase
VGKLEKPRVALIGLGGVGELHLAAYHAIDSIEVVAAAEPNAPRRNALLAGTGIPGFDDHRDMLRSCPADIACVLTPAASHEPVVLDCAAAGVNVLCEKPIAPSLEAAERMRAACEAAAVRFCYGASYRYLPAIRAARELIREGAIGRVQLMREDVVGGKGAANWRALPDSHYPAGGPGGSGMGLMDHGIHLIDVFRWFTGREVIRVNGRGNLSGAAPRTEYLHMDFDGGAAGLLVYNDATFPAVLPSAGLYAEGDGWDSTGFVPAGAWSANPGSIEVYGSEGSLRVYYYANALFQFTAAGTRRIPLNGRPSTAHFGTQIETFAASLTADGPVPVDAEAGIRALAVALAAYDADASGKASLLSGQTRIRGLSQS